MLPLCHLLDWKQILSSSLDLYKHNRNKFCGKNTLKGAIVENGVKKTRFVRLGCKSWNCEICGPRKASKYRYSINENAQNMKLDRFLTLTLDPRKSTPENSLPHIKQCWAKLRTYIKRKFRYTLSFICIVEFQKNEYAHLHVLLDRFLPQKWISNTWDKLGGGKIVFIEKVEFRKISYYITKYLTKDTAFNNSGIRYRKCTTSKDIKLNYKKKSGEWILMTVPIEYLREHYIKKDSKEKRDKTGMLHWFEL